MNIRYRVDLSETGRNELTALRSGGTHAARKLKRAQILPAGAVRVSGATICRTNRRFVEGNLELAQLAATACSSPPEGRKRWTLDLLAGEMVRLTGHAELSR